MDLKTGLPEAAHTDWDVVIAQLAPRIGSVFIAIFVMQALISFARYKFRLSDNLANMADICDGSEGDLQNLTTLSQVYLPDIGDISQFIQSPTDKAIELAKDAIAKLPKP